MPNYKLLIQYDGTKYKGWQIQKSTDDTIQGKLQGVISKMAGYPVEVTGSGRTDAGVHAKGQVANVHIKDEITELTAFCEKMNSYLPEDIAVLSIEIADERFHARYSAKSKTYLYRIHISSISNVFDRKYVYSYTDSVLDIEKMRSAARLLLGEHDFKSFCANKHMKKSTIRRIDSISITESGKEIQIEYTGDGFLQNMVRIITGTLIEVGNGSRSAQSISDTIKSLNRENAGFTAPAKGLCLLKVIY